MISKVKLHLALRLPSILILLKILTLLTVWEDNFFLHIHV